MIPLTHGLILASVLFVLGLTGLVIRRNLLFMLISLEIMINAAALAFVVAGSYWGQTDGQIMYILAITLAAAEASIGLALLLQLHRRRQNLSKGAPSFTWVVESIGYLGFTFMIPIMGAYIASSTLVCCEPRVMMVV